MPILIFSNAALKSAAWSGRGVMYSIVLCYDVMLRLHLGSTEFSLLKQNVFREPKFIA